MGGMYRQDAALLDAIAAGGAIHCPLASLKDRAESMGLIEMIDSST